MTNFFNNISFDWFWNILDFLVNLLFGWIHIPQMPRDIVYTISSFFDLIFSNVSLLGFFIRPTTIKIVIPVILFLFNFKWIYHCVIWLIKKIPFLRYKLIWLSSCGATDSIMYYCNNYKKECFF